MRKSRGEPSERMVEPITVRLFGDEEVSDVNLESWTEVMMMCGTE